MVEGARILLQVEHWKGIAKMTFEEIVDAEERYCKEQIALIMEAYRKDVQPYVDRLVAIEARKASRPLYIGIDAAMKPGIYTTCIIDELKDGTLQVKDISKIEAK